MKISFFDLAGHTPQTPTATISIHAIIIVIIILPSIQIFAFTFSERLNSNSNEAHEKIAKPTIKGTLITIHIIRYGKKIIKI